MGNTHKIFKTSENFIIGTYEFAKFQYYRIREILRFGNYKYPYKEILKDKRVYVLANGPSLKAELSILLNDGSFMNSPKFVVNNFCSSDLFQILRPEYYCIADPAFFSADKYISLLRDINESVSWPMKLYMPNWGVKKIKKFFTNQNVTIVPISPLRFTGYESLRYRYYKKGKGMPCYVNVTIMVEYILLNMGCKDIWLYGVDHSFLSDLCVNDNNQLCITERHFHEKDYLKVMEIHGANGDVWHMKDFIYNKYLTFLEHERMRGYADYVGARIINCTKLSMIDAYVRLAQLEKEKA